MKQAQNKEDRFEQAAFEQAIHGFAQSTEIQPIKINGKVIDMDDVTDPNAGKDMFLDGPSIPMEVVESQEEGKKAVKVKPRSEIDLRTLAEKEAFYKMAIDKDEKLIVVAKERIKFNKIRLRKLESFLAAQKRAAERINLSL